MRDAKYILGLDTSCDETSLALFDVDSQTVVANWISSQIQVHQAYGGVVPELASRQHAENLPVLFEEILQKNAITANQISAIAVTQTPGLLGCLLVGASFAKALAYRLKVPLLAVNHLQAHLFSPYIHRLPPFPFLGLVVSGGHTAFYRARSFFDIDLLGQTVDDAAGEAFDKGAKLMGLGYPGGPIVDKRARLGDPAKYAFRLPKIKWSTEHLSFSGIKTALLHHVQKLCDEHRILRAQDLPETRIHDLCASLQSIIVETLCEKMSYFLRADTYSAFALSGGVAMNSLLRKRVQDVCATQSLPCDLAKPEFCTDNAAMVAYLANHQRQATSVLEFSPRATQRLTFKDLRS